MALRGRHPGADTAAPAERIHRPGSTTVVSDLGTTTGLPQYTAQGQSADHPVAAATEPGTTDARRLLLSAPAASDGAGTLHYALVADGAAAPTPEVRAAAQRELGAWLASAGFPAS